MPVSPPQPRMQPAQQQVNSDVPKPANRLENMSNSYFHIKKQSNLQQECLIFGSLLATPTKAIAFMRVYF